MPLQLPMLMEKESVDFQFALNVLRTLDYRGPHDHTRRKIRRGKVSQ
jgi:hypothetical protein